MPEVKFLKIETNNKDQGNFIGMKIEFGVDNFNNNHLTKACKFLYTNKISCLTVLNITILTA